MNKRAEETYDMMSCILVDTYLLNVLSIAEL